MNVSMLKHTAAGVNPLQKVPSFTFIYLVDKQMWEPDVVFLQVAMWLRELVIFAVLYMCGLNLFDFMC